MVRELSLGPHDAALIVHSDGTLSTIIPPLPDVDTMEVGEPAAAVTALAYLLQNADRDARLGALLKELCRLVNEGVANA